MSDSTTHLEDAALAADVRVAEWRALSLKLTVTARQMHKKFDHSVAAIGITRSQWTLVAVAARRPGITQREVAEVLEISEASAGRLVDRLCTDGMIVRQPKEDDRRAHAIYLTDSADELLKKINRVAATYERTLFEGFAPDDLERFTLYLDRLAANLAKVV